MANPWTKKNPFLSMVLSTTNAAAGRTRGLWMQQARRNQATAVKQATRSWTEMWSPVPKRKRRK